MVGFHFIFYFYSHSLLSLGFLFVITNGAVALLSLAIFLPFPLVLYLLLYKFIWKEDVNQEITGGIQRDVHKEEILKEEKERCSGSYRLAVGFLVIKDEISNE